MSSERDTLLARSHEEVVDMLIFTQSELHDARKNWAYATDIVDRQAATLAQNAKEIARLNEEIVEYEQILDNAAARGILFARKKQDADE